MSGGAPPSVDALQLTRPLPETGAARRRFPRGADRRSFAPEDPLITAERRPAVPRRSGTPTSCGLKNIYWKQYALLKKRICEAILYNFTDH